MPAKTKTPTQAEMKARIARFNDLVSTKARHAESKGIPQEVMEMITAKSTFNVMSPADLGGQLSPKPAVVGGDAGVFRLGIATCPAGNGPGLHVHWKTHETFMALTGRWEIRWGDHGEERTQGIAHGMRRSRSATAAALCCARGWLCRACARRPALTVRGESVH